MTWKSWRKKNVTPSTRATDDCVLTVGLVGTYSHLGENWDPNLTPKHLPFNWSAVRGVRWTKLLSKTVEFCGKYLIVFNQNQLIGFDLDCTYIEPIFGLLDALVYIQNHSLDYISSIKLILIRISGLGPNQIHHYHNLISNKGVCIECPNADALVYFQHSQPKLTKFQNVHG